MEGKIEKVNKRYFANDLNLYVDYKWFKSKSVSYASLSVDCYNFFGVLQYILYLRIYVYDTNDISMPKLPSILYLLESLQLLQNAQLSPPASCAVDYSRCTAQDNASNVSINQKCLYVGHEAQMEADDTGMVAGRNVWESTQVISFSEAATTISAT